MCRKVLCVMVGCLLLTATTALAGDRGQIEATPITLPGQALTDGFAYLGPQPEPPDLPVQDKLDPFEWFVRWLFDFGR